MQSDDYVPISALQHMAFCPRQAALIHVEQVWAENSLTIEGQHLHRNVDEPHLAIVQHAQIVRRLPIWSDEFRLTGFADVVELRPLQPPKNGIVPYPVEYKRGRPKRDRCDEIQLCAQAICLAERFGVDVPEGALFYGQKRRRQTVVVTAELRAETVAVLERFRAIRETEETPRVDRQPKCQSCSLLELCRPDQTGPSASAKSYLRSLIREAERQS